MEEKHISLFSPRFQLTGYFASEAYHRACRKGVSWELRSQPHKVSQFWTEIDINLTKIYQFWQTYPGCEQKAMEIDGNLTEIDAFSQAQFIGSQAPFLQSC